jgi:hypothetical protein
VRGERENDAIKIRPNKADENQRERAEVRREEE